MLLETAWLDSSINGGLTLVRNEPVVDGIVGGEDMGEDIRIDGGVAGIVGGEHRADGWMSKSASSFACTSSNGSSCSGSASGSGEAAGASCKDSVLRRATALGHHFDK